MILTFENCSFALSCGVESGARAETFTLIHLLSVFVWLDIARFLFLLILSQVPVSLFFYPLLYSILTICATSIWLGWTLTFVF